MQDAAIPRFASMLAALSQPTRLRIVSIVARGPDEGTPAGQIARAVKCPASTLSFHLKELTQAGLLAAEPQGRFIRYRVVPGALHALSEFVRSLPGAGASPGAGAGVRARGKAARKAPKAAGKREEGQLSIFEE